MSIVRSSVHAKWIVGKVIGTAMQKTAKVRVTRLVLDPYLLKKPNARKFMQEQAFLPLVAGTSFPLAPRTRASLLRLPEGTQDPGWLPSGPGFIRKDVWNDVRKMSCYFNKRKTYFAHDALQQCTVGDIVLLKALPVPRTKHVKHELAEIIFKVGQVIDPVSGKPCAGTAYLESPVNLETTHLTKTPEEHSISSEQ